MKEKEVKPDVTDVTLDPQSPEYAANFWRAGSADTGLPLRLPSGVTVRARQYPLHEMLLRGRLPKTLQAAALRVYNDGAVALTAELAAENIAFVDAVITYCLVAPQVYDNQTPASADAMSVHLIPLRDRLRLFTWGLGEVSAERDYGPFCAAPTP